MQATRFAVLLAVLILSLVPAGVAQRADAAFVVGGSFVSDSNVVFSIPCGIILCTPTTFNNTIKTGNHVFFAGSGAFRMVSARVVSLHLELPVAAVPSQKLTNTGPPTIDFNSLTSVFVTPALRVKLLPGSSISPWGSIGGGWARYSVDFGPTSNNGALQYGGGVDFKTPIPHLGFRAEVRDFVTGHPDPGVGIFLIQSQNGLRHNVLAGGGVVLNF